MHTLASVTSILHGIASTMVRAKLPNGISRAIRGVTKEAVTEVVAVLDELPYVDVLRTDAGYLKGLSIQYREKGCCSIYHTDTEPGEYQTYVDGTMTGSVSEYDGHRFSQLRDEVTKQAAARGMPLFNNVSQNHVTVLAPFVLEALLKKATSNAHA